MSVPLPNSVTKILVVEDNPAHARLLKEVLAEIAELRFELVQCETLKQALKYLGENQPDICLVDLDLPDAQALDAVRRVRAAAPNVPLVVLSEFDDETLAIRSLNEGAQDYLVKSLVGRSSLWRSLRYAMERQRLNLQLLSLSLHDELTGLNNRRGFVALAEHHIKLAYRAGEPFLVVFIDLDGLKQINDTFGHQEGNRALVDAAGVLNDSFRQSDILARIGGDEFAVLVTNAAGNSIQTVLHRVQQKLNAFNAALDRHYPLSFSIGIVSADLAQSCTLEILLSRADKLMYEQKHGKRAACAATELDK